MEPVNQEPAQRPAACPACGSKAVGDAGENDYRGHGVAVPGLRRGLEGRQAAGVVALKVHGHVLAPNTFGRGRFLGCDCAHGGVGHGRIFRRQPRAGRDCQRPAACRHAGALERRSATNNRRSALRRREIPMKAPDGSARVPWRSGRCPRCEHAAPRPLQRVSVAHALWCECRWCGHIWVAAHANQDRHAQMYGRS